MDENENLQFHVRDHKTKADLGIVKLPVKDLVDATEVEKVTNSLSLSLSLSLSHSFTDRKSVV